MVQGTRAHMEHTGWRHQHQRQDTHNLTAPTTRRTNDHQVHSYTLCQTNCSSARDGRRASYRKYMKTVGEPGHPQCWSSTRGRPLVGGRETHHIEHHSSKELDHTDGTIPSTIHLRIAMLRS